MYFVLVMFVIMSIRKRCNRLRAQLDFAQFWPFVNACRNADDIDALVVLAIAAHFGESLDKQKIKIFTCNIHRGHC